MLRFRSGTWHPRHFPLYRPELTGQDGASPAVQWLSLHAPITGDTGLIPHQERTHMLHGTAKKSRGDAEPKLSVTAESRTRTARVPAQNQEESTLETSHPVSVSMALLTSLLQALLTTCSRRGQAASRRPPGMSSRTARRGQRAEPHLCPEALLGTGGRTTLPVGLHGRSRGNGTTAVLHASWKAVSSSALSNCSSTQQAFIQGPLQALN